MRYYLFTLATAALLCISTDQAYARAGKDAAKKAHQPVKEPIPQLKPQNANIAKKTSAEKDSNSQPKAGNKLLNTGTGIAGEKSAKVPKTTSKEVPKETNAPLAQKSSKQPNGQQTKRPAKNSLAPKPKLMQANYGLTQPGGGPQSGFSGKGNNVQSYMPSQSGSYGQQGGMQSGLNPTQAGSIGQSINPSMSGSLGQVGSTAYGQGVSGGNGQPGYGNQQQNYPNAWQQNDFGQQNMGPQQSMGPQQNMGPQPNLGAQQPYGPQQPYSPQQPFDALNQGNPQANVGQPYGYGNQFGNQQEMGQNYQYGMQNQGMPQQNMGQQNYLGEFGTPNGQNNWFQQNPYNAQGQFGMQQGYGQNYGNGMQGGYDQQQGAGGYYSNNWYNGQSSYTPHLANPYPKAGRYSRPNKALRRPKVVANRMKDILMPGSPPQTWHNPTCFYKGRYYTPGKVVEIKMKIKKVLVCVLTSDLAPVIGSIPLSSLPCWPKQRE